MFATLPLRQEQLRKPKFEYHTLEYVPAALTNVKGTQNPDEELL
jgi:hypothetical protein